MALTNCTIDSSSVNVTKNNTLSGVAHQVLTITPNTGYRVAAADFSQNTDLTAAPWVNQINAITLANKNTDTGGTGTAYAANNVVTVTVDLKDSYTASDNATFTIDIDGAAKDEKLASVVCAGTWDQVVNGNVTASPVTNASNNAYSVTGTPDEIHDLIEQTFTCASGYYFTTDPTFTKTSVGTYGDNYLVEKTPLTYSNGKLTSIKFKIQLKNPGVAFSGHNLDFSANAVTAFSTQANLVTGYNLSGSQTTVAAGGGTRNVKIYGNAGASAKMTIQRADDSYWYNFSTNLFQSGSADTGNLTIPSNGIYELTGIEIPAINTGGGNVTDTYNFALVGGTSPSTNTVEGGTGNNNPYTWTLTQSADKKIIITGSGTNLSVGVNAGGVDRIENIPVGGENYDINGVLLGGDKILWLEVTHSSGKNLKLRRQPVFAMDVAHATDGTMDFTNAVEASNNGMAWDIAGLVATGDGTAKITIKSGTYTSGGNTYNGFFWTDGGTADVTSNLSLDNFINQAPVTLNKPFSGPEDTPLVIDLSANSAATDPEGDTLTYSIVADNTGGNGSLGSVDSGTGVVTFTPTAAWNGSTNFTWKVNDGYEDSNTSTASITITAVNDAPTNIALSSQTIAEDSAINTVVGAFSTTDPDAGDTHTYTLVSGTGDTDNASFNISGSNLRSSAVFDYETKSSYSIRVRSTDNGGLWYEKSFTITVTFVPHERWEISIYNSSGSLTGVHHVSAEKICDGGGLINMPAGCFQLNHWVRWRTYAGGCGSTEYGRGKITNNTSISDGTPTAYISGDVHFGSSDDSYNNTGGTNC